MTHNPRSVSWNNTYIRALGEIILDDKIEGSNAYAEAMAKRFRDKDFTRNSVGRAIRAYRGRLKDLFTPQEEAKIVAKFFSNTPVHKAKVKHQKELAKKRQQPASVKRSTRTLQKPRAPTSPTPSASPVPTTMPKLKPLKVRNGDLVRVETVRDTMCRFPFGDPSDKDFAFCGRKIARGSYCEDHARFMYQPKKDKKETVA